MQALMWASSCVGIVMSIALLVVALVKVRKANSGAGMMLAGSGATTLLAMCCARGMAMYAETGGAETIFRVRGLLSAVAGIIAMGLLIAGFVVLAKAGKDAPAGGREA